MSVVITRTPWIDDDGTGTTGTVLNNAMKTGLYNEIDTALAKVAQLAGGNTFTGNQTIAGLLTVSAPGAANHQWTASTVNVITLQQTVAGPSNYAAVFVQNDAAIQAILQCFSSTWGAIGAYIPSGAALRGTGSGGMSITAEHASGAVRFYAGGNVERMRIAPTGEVLVNMAATGGPAQMQITSHQGSTWGQMIRSQVDVAGGIFVAYVNASGTPQGSVNCANSTSVAYNTTSDARLKDDAGRATEVAALRAVVVHDFTWKADGTRARGVFAQEAADVFPSAITEGTDETTDDGVTLARPWMTDYSKFVPDLIVGWQQHDAELADLRALLATLKGFPNA